jgi:hypothetical protein
MSHTPGPWRIDAEYIRDVQAGQEDDPVEIASTAEATLHGGHHFPPIGEQRANARLIAAAPELLMALKATAGNIRSLREAKVCNTYDNWLEVVEAAIAKAEARQ